MSKLARGLLALYAGIAYAILCAGTTYTHPIIFDLLEGNANNFWTERPDYFLGYWILLFSIPLIASFYAVPMINRVIPSKKQGFANAVVGFAVFMIAILAVWWNFNYDVIFLTFGFMYSTVIALTEGLAAHKFDFAFVAGVSINMELRRAKLQSMYDRWARSLTWFLGLLALLMISSTLNVVNNISASFGIKVTSLYQGMLLTHIIVLAPGAVLGICWRIFQKMCEIEDQILNIRTSVD